MSHSSLLFFFTFSINSMIDRNIDKRANLMRIFSFSLSFLLIVIQKKTFLLYRKEFLLPNYFSDDKHHLLIDVLCCSISINSFQKIERKERVKCTLGGLEDEKACTYTYIFKNSKYCIIHHVLFLQINMSVLDENAAVSFCKLRK